MNIQQMTKVIQQAKLWLQQNLPPKESKHQYWVDGNEVVHKCPPGSFFDYQTGRFVPLKK